MGEYKNVIRTKTKIKQALVELLQDNNLSKINIINITRLANVSRNTFYSHYSDANDVIDEIENDLINKFILYFESEFPDYVNPKDSNKFFNDLLSFVYRNADLIIILCNPDKAPHFLEKFKKNFINKTIEKINNIYIKDKRGFSLYLNIFFSGVSDFIKNSLTGEISINNDELANTINQIFLDSCERYIILK